MNSSGCSWSCSSCASSRSGRLPSLVRMSPNLSLNPDASPAALTRRPLGAGYLGSLGADAAMPRILALAFLCVGMITSAYAEPWPAVLPLTKEYLIDFSSEWVSIDLPIAGISGKTGYLFWCRGGSTENLDAYEEKTGTSFVGSFLCRLNEGATPQDISLLQEDGAAVWYSRGLFSEPSVTGACAAYPEYGARRTFALRN